MVKNIKFSLILFILILLIFIPSFVNAFPAHFIIGDVYNATDGTSPNGRTVHVYRQDNPNDNLTDTIGPTGGSGQDNRYLVDCQAFSTPCAVSDVVNVTVYDDGSNYVTWYSSVTVTGAAFDAAPNLTLNTPSNVSSVIIDDSDLDPVNELDLLAGSNLTVFCNATLRDSDGYLGIESASAILYDNISSSSSDSDDMVNHYTNSSCTLFTGSGETRGAECGFSVAYYANNATWSCNVTVTDNHSISGATNYDYSNVNKLIALSLPSSIDYGNLAPGQVSSEQILNVTNVGNTPLTISVFGYANGQTTSPNALNCTEGSSKNITLSNERYNVTATGETFSDMFPIFNTSNQKSWSQFVVGKQTSEGVLIKNSTYWKLQLPTEVGGNCRGVISITATES